MNVDEGWRMRLTSKYEKFIVWEIDVKIWPVYHTKDWFQNMSSMPYGKLTSKYEKIDVRIRAVYHTKDWCQKMSTLSYERLTSKYEQCFHTKNWHQIIKS